MSRFPKLATVRVPFRTLSLVALALAALIPLFATARAKALNFSETSIVCSEPGRVNILELCNVTVEDPTDPETGRPSRPTGEVRLSSNTQGTFRNQAGVISNNCILEARGAPFTGECRFISYTPTALGNGVHVLSANYRGDSNHIGSTGEQSLRLLHPTRNEIFCFPVLSHSGTIRCEDLITDEAPAATKQTPTGSVELSALNATVEPKKCPLTQFISELGPIIGEAICVYNVKPQPTGEGKFTVSLGSSYLNTNVHEGSGTSTSVVFPGISHTSVNCTPAKVVLGHNATCTIIAEAAPGEVLGTNGAELRSSQPATFPANNVCQIKGGTRAASCTVEIKPSVVGNPTLTARYGGAAGVEASEGTTSFEVIRESKVSLACTPTAVQPGEQSSCVAVVEDPVGGPPGEARPTGSVSFSTSSQGTFLPDAVCQLAPPEFGGGSSSDRGSAASPEDTASCQIFYQPSKTGEHILGVKYNGDARHLTSESSRTVVAHRLTMTEIACDPAGVSVGVTTTCTAKVTDTSPAPTHPEGRVDFFNEGSGAFEGNSFCALSAAEEPDESTCSVEYKPTAVGTGKHKITAFYDGVAGVDPSQASTLVQVGNPTATALSCTPASRPEGVATHCTATVTDEGTPPSAPTGKVEFVSDAQGTFSATECELKTDGQGHRSCGVDYTPAAGSAGTHHIDAHYPGDAQHQESAAPQFALTVVEAGGGGGGGGNPSVTHVICNPADVILGGGSACTVTVESPAAGSDVPTGEVEFSDGAGGVFANPCRLIATQGGKASCQTVYVPTGAGARTVKAGYPGDEGHEASSDQFAVQVAAQNGGHEVGTSVSCEPSPVILGGAAVCTVKVRDIGAAPTAPTGLVVLATDGAGSFDTAGCVLFAEAGATSRCQVTYTPASVGTGNHKIAALYSGDAGHEPGLAATQLAVSATNGGHPTTTALKCEPATVGVGAPTECKATVTDTEPGASPPRGAVVLGSNSPGSFNRGACILEGDGAATSCHLTYTPSAAGGAPHRITASYVGEQGHEPSVGEATVNVGGSVPPPPPVTQRSTPNTKFATRPHRPRRKTASHLVRFGFTSDPPGSSFECKLDRAAYRRCASPFKARVRPGVHVFRVRAVGLNGVADPTPAAYRWKVMGHAKRKKRHKKH